MQVTLIDQGLSLMLFGMGTVFVFLTLLVFATTFMSKMVNRLVPNIIEDPKVSQTSTAADNSQSIEPQTLEAIKLAIKAHRSR